MASTAGPEKKEDEEATTSQPPARSGHKKELYPMVNWKYDIFLYVIGNLVDTFFREVVPRGSWKIPRTGPVLFVAAPHANQVSGITSRDLHVFS
jgi:glycerol-3-phosphate O-acyltransferase/dihydroxyacetone phosphate acyltransferase